MMKLVDVSKYNNEKDICELPPIDLSTLQCMLCEKKPDSPGLFLFNYTVAEFPACLCICANCGKDFLKTIMQNPMMFVIKLMQQKKG